jgi:3-methyladenine DNA glycosylase AlkD
MDKMTETSEIVKEEKQFKFDFVRKGIVQSLKEISEYSEQLFRYMQKTKTQLIFLIL